MKEWRDIANKLFDIAEIVQPMILEYREEERKLQQKLREIKVLRRKEFWLGLTYQEKRRLYD